MGPVTLVCSDQDFVAVIGINISRCKIRENYSYIETIILYTIFVEDVQKR